MWLRTRRAWHVRGLYGDPLCGTKGLVYDTKHGPLYESTFWICASCMMNKDVYTNPRGYPCPICQDDRRHYHYRDE